MNVVDKFKTSDGKPTINGKTTLNLSPAIARSYEWARDFGDDVVLEIPPAKRYGVDAYSVDEYITLYPGQDQAWGRLTIRGSGMASKILPLSTSNLAEKLILSAGGPQSMSCFVEFENLDYVGDPTANVDCFTLIRTDPNVRVRVRNLRCYGLRASGANGLFDFGATGMDVNGIYFHGCGHTDSTKGLLTLRSGLFGGRLQHVYIYPSEHHLASVQKDPFVEAAFEKSPLTPCYGIRLCGDALSNAPSYELVQCAAGGAGIEGFVIVDPGTDHVYSVKLDGCRIRDNVGQTIRIVGNTKYVSLSDTKIQHGASSKDTIELCASSAENLSIDRVNMTSAHTVSACNGQRSVRVIQSHGGNYDVTGASSVEFDPSSTYDSLVGP